MTDAVVKLRGKLPKDSSIHRMAEALYDEGKGTRGLALVHWIVDETKDGLDGDGVRIATEKFEVVPDDFEDETRKLYDQLVKARLDREPQLPYDETRVEKLHAALEQWAADNDLSTQDVQTRWNEHFNASGDPESVVPGPKGATEDKLWLFLHSVGAAPEAEQTQLDVDTTAGDDATGPTEPPLDES